jgi:hypothetical protein
MLPVFLNTLFMVSIVLFFVRFLEAHLPDGALNDAIHYLYK